MASSDQMVAQTGSPKGVMEMLPSAMAGGDPPGVLHSRQAATAAARSSPDAMAAALADPTLTEGPEFYLPDHAVYSPIRIRNNLVLKTTENNKLWEATNHELKTRKSGIVCRLEKNDERPCAMDGAGRESYLPRGHRIYGTTDDSNWVKIVGKNPKPNFDQFSTMMKAFPESPDRPFQNSLADRI